MNLGDDADTTGAIYGQLAGTWLECLAEREIVGSYADGLREYGAASVAGPTG